MDQSSSDSDAEVQSANAVFILSPNNQPIPMYLHESLGTGGKKAIAKKITEAGGVVTTDEDNAEVIICRDDRPAFKQLERKYDHFRYVWVEAPSWVEDCIRRRRYKHISPGQITAINRGARIGFTSDDDEHLCNFLAHRIPFKETGGRLGNGVYKDLVHSDNARLYPWAKRHSWMSWRERYKTNQDIFDRGIIHIVREDEDPPEPGGKGQYIIPRRKKKNVQLRHMVQSGDSEESEEEDELQDDDEFEIEEDVVPKPALKKRTISQYDPRHRRIDEAPRKRRRYESGEGSDGGVDHRMDKGKERQEQHHSNESLVQAFDVDDLDYELGTGRSQFVGARRDDPTLSPRMVTTKTSSYVAPSTSAFLNREPLASQPPQNGRLSGRSFSTQKTIANESDMLHSPRAGPPDTQATLVQASQSHTRVSRPSFSEVRDQNDYPNTRSRPRSTSDLPPDGPAFPPPKRGRGRRRKVQRPRTPPQESFPPTGEQSHQLDSLRAPGIASALDEARVEAILEENTAQGNGKEDSGESSDSSSSDDQEAERELIAGQNKMVGLDVQARASEKTRPPRPRASKNPPQIDLTARARITSPLRKPSLLRPSTTPKHALGIDPDDTLKARPALVDSKNTKDHDAPSLSERSDRETSGGETETNASSFPAEPTDAWEFETAKSSFKPGPGTRAEKYQSSKAKGKRKAV